MLEIKRRKLQRFNKKNFLSFYVIIVSMKMRGSFDIYEKKKKNMVSYFSFPFPSFYSVFFIPMELYSS